MNRYQVRCIKMLSEGAIIEAFFGVVNVSFTAEEFARLTVLSHMAAQHSF